MDEFEGEGRGHGPFPGAAEDLAGEEAEGGTDGFARVLGGVEEPALPVCPGRDDIGMGRKAGGCRWEEVRPTPIGCRRHNG